MNNPIRVFLSYSWDSEDHKQRVLALAQRLRDDGVDAWLDRFTSFPEKGWARWMEEEIERSQFVVVLATKNYAQRFAGNAPAGTGLGATWEGAIITQDLYEAGGRNKKFLPAIFAPADSAHIPKPLRPFTCFRVDTDGGYTDLYRLITGQPEILASPIGKKRDLPSAPVGAQRPALPVPEIHEPIALSAVHQLPPPPPAFTGRDEDLRQLEQQLTSAHAAGATISATHRHAGLQGMGGVGKTALALVLADRLKSRYPDAQLFLNLRGADPENRPPMPAADVMASVIHAFHPEARLPDTVEALAPIYRSVLTDAGRVLLLLDNAAGADQVRPLLPPANCLLLVTSRTQFTLPGLAARNLDCLQPPQAQELLCKLAPRFQAGSDEVKEAAKLCGHLPLALEVFAGAVNDRQLYPLPELLRRLRERQDKLAPVDAAFQVSYELLTEELRRCWRLLAVFPASFDLRAAAAVWNAESSSSGRESAPSFAEGSQSRLTSAATDSAREAMQALMHASLVEWNEANGRFRLHDLVRQFCEARSLETENLQLETSEARLRHAAHYRDVGAEAGQLYLKGGEHVLRGLELFDRERAHIEAAFEFLTRLLSPSLSSAPSGGEGARRAGEEESAALLVSLVDAVAYTGDLRFHPRQTIRWREAQRNAARLTNNQQQEGDALEVMALSHRQLGNIRTAIGFHEQSLAIYRINSDRQREGTALGNLGLAYADLGDARKAIEFYEQHRDIAREIGDRRGEGNALGNLGLANAALGDARKAIEFYEQQLKIVREIGDRRGEGNALFNSALALNMLGDRAQAIARAEAALLIYEAIEDPNAAQVRAQLAQWRAAP